MSPSHRQILAPDPAAIRTVLGHFATGVAIITAIDGDEPVGMACNSFTSVSLEPQLVLFCAAKSSSTWPRIQAAQKWAANILTEDGEEICRLFAQKGADRFAHIAYTIGRTGAPVLDDALAFVDCETIAEHDAGDHVIVVGQRARARLRDRGQAVALLPRRLRALRGLSARLARSTLERAPEPIGEVDAGRRGDDRDHRLDDREDPADEADAEHERQARDRQDRRRRARPGRGPSRRRPARSRRDVAPTPAAGARSSVRTRRWRTLAWGPTSAPIASTTRERGNEPRDPEHEGGEQRDADHALRDPVGPGVDHLDRLVHRSTRLIHRRATLIAEPRAVASLSASTLTTRVLIGPQARSALFPKRARFATLRVQGRPLGGVSVRRRHSDRGDSGTHVERRRAGRAWAAPTVLAGTLDVEPDPRVDAPRPALAPGASGSTPIVAYLWYRIAHAQPHPSRPAAPHAEPDPDPAAGRADRRARASCSSSR